jgi:sorting nexin-4
LATDNAELGALYNGFSLTETDNLALAIEKVGQAIDIVYLSDGALVSNNIHD